MTFNSWREGYDYLTRLMSRKSIPQGKWGGGYIYLGLWKGVCLLKITLLVCHYCYSPGYAY